MMIIDYIPAMGETIGKGFDIIRDGIRSQISADTETQSVEINSSTSKIQLIEHSSSVSRVVEDGLGVDSSSFGIGYSFAIDFIRSINSRSNRVNVFIFSRIVTRSESIVNQEMSEIAKNEGDQISFMNKYGTMYVYSKIYGAMLCASISIEIDSDDERETLVQSLSFHNGASNVFQEHKDEFLSKIKNKSVNVSVRYSGLRIDKTPVSVDDLIELFINFNGLAMQGNSVVSLGLLPISSMKNYGYGVGVTFNRDVMNAIMDSYIRYNVLLNRVNSVIDRDSMYDFDSIDMNSMVIAKSNIQKKIAKISNCQRMVASGKSNSFSVMDPAIFEDGIKFPDIIKKIKPADFSMYPLERYHGDGEMMNGNGAHIYFEVGLHLSEDGKILYVGAHGQIEERKGDFTGYRLDVDGIVVFDASGTNYKIVKFSPAVGRVQRTVPGGQEFVWYAGEGLVKELKCRVDTMGIDDGNVGAETIKLNEVKVFLRKN